MKIRTYKIVLLLAASLSGWGSLVALYFVLASRGWADIISASLLALAGMIVAGFAAHRIIFPHDHPSPRYRSISGGPCRS